MKLKDRYFHGMENKKQREDRLKRQAKERVKKARADKDKEEQKEVNEKGTELFDAILGAILEEGKGQDRKKGKRKG